jgi:predicted Rossmann fold nucleotide-binding protein DprA/Smf involved in DNA uptake
MLLISDMKPDAGFSAGRAMNRNKFIYASAMGTFVVESDYNKGGTWTGATEAIKNQWGKVYVCDNKSEGNTGLIEKGGIAYEPDGGKLLELINKQPKERKEDEYRQMSLSDIIIGA